MSTPQIWNIGIGVSDAMKQQPGWNEVVLASEYSALEDRLKALEEQLAVAQAGAARYQWLTDGKRGDWCWSNVLSDQHRALGSDLDDVIDAALTLEAAHG